MTEQQFAQKMAAALKKGFESGFIEDINDPWESLPCFGNYDPYSNTRFNCDKCDLCGLCYETYTETSHNH